MTAKERVLALLEKDPSTDAEIAKKLKMSQNTARPRRVELEMAGLIVPIGFVLQKNGRRAMVWSAVSRVTKVQRLFK